MRPTTTFVVEISGITYIFSLLRYSIKGEKRSLSFNHYLLTVYEVDALLSLADALAGYWIQHYLVIQLKQALTYEPETSIQAIANRFGFTE